MLNIRDVKAALAGQISMYLDREQLELEYRGETGTAPDLNSCVLLVGIGNRGAKTVSQMMRQLNLIGIYADDYTGLALVDANYMKRDDRIKYIVIEDYNVVRYRVPEKLLEIKDYLAGTLETLNIRLTKIMNRTSANIKVYVVGDLSEDLFAGCTIFLCLLEDKLNSFFVANTGIEFTGLFFQSALLKTKQEQAKVFASWQEIKLMSSPGFRLDLDLGDFPGQRTSRVYRDKPVLAISYLYSDFNENFSPILRTVDEGYSVAEMLATLVYLKSSSQLSEARIFNSLQMPSPTVANGLPRFAAIGYNKKSIKISPIFSYTCWCLLNKIFSVNQGKADYHSQDWEAILHELEIDNSALEILGAEVYSSVNETLQEIEDLHLQLEKKVVKELLTETLDTVEKLLIGNQATIIFEEKILKAAQHITENYLPQQLERFANIINGLLPKEQCGLFFVKQLLISEEGNHLPGLIKHLELKGREFRTQSDALRLKANRASQLALSRLGLEPDKKGVLGLGNKKNNFLQRLVEVKYRLLQKAVVYDQIREIIEGYLGYSRNLYAAIVKQEESIQMLEKALQELCNSERQKLVAAGEDGLLDLFINQITENKKEEIVDEVWAMIFRENDLSLGWENNNFYKSFVKALFENTSHLLRQTNIQILSLEKLLESLTQTQPAKGHQIVEDLYAKCHLALSLSKGVMARQPETHYYFFNNEGNSSLRSYIKRLFQVKPHDIMFADYKSLKSVRMLKVCFGFDLKDIYFYKNYQGAYEIFGPNR